MKSLKKDFYLFRFHDAGSSLGGRNLLAEMVENIIKLNYVRR